MKILFIGGTGTISMAITKRLGELGEELYLLNRGNRSQNLPENVHSISCDISDEAAAAKALEGMTFDCVADFIAFTPDQVERDYRLFRMLNGLKAELPQLQKEEILSRLEAVLNELK